MGLKRIVITGGPGTGKSTIINELIKQDFTCMEEISRQVTLDAQKEGIEQLFLTNPLLFSELLLKGRISQFKNSEKTENNIVFFDRGIPDVLAYMDYIGGCYPEDFVTHSQHFVYDVVFILKPWEAIYKSDNERYESFSQAQKIHDYLLETYQSFNYSPIDVPFGTVEERTNFILNTLSLN
ncbi:AAA family ATPase [Hyunsoonleella pacifica]|uniref:ATPase n=1 Tax=Hyunsoonleella pacifica TaxID=1080224 RepID=A0A4Q9FU36_9FLAO|nr:ATP-binding protein [Hyunsoonleella pacifica]TBN18819.1 ATPase [Hyunsoonleella pacifica]GGD05017.1 ATPase [Hyunsoonleella pacifica]